MNTMLMTMNAWYWFGFALLLYIVELITGTGFLLWMGISATITSLFLWVMPTINLNVQCVLFSILSVLAALSWRVYLHYYPTKTDKPTLNKRADQYIGRIFTLTSPIVNGMGKIIVDDSVWCLQCNEDLAVGTRIYIYAAESTMLMAKQCDKT